MVHEIVSVSEEMSGTRRTSSRIRQIQESESYQNMLRKEREYNEYEEDDRKTMKRNRKNGVVVRKQKIIVTGSSSGHADMLVENTNDDDAVAVNGVTDVPHTEEQQQLVVYGGVSPTEQQQQQQEVANRGPRSDKQQVIDTIRAFNKHYLHFVQEEEKRATEREAERKKAKDAVLDGQNEIKHASRRPDLKAITKMRVMNTILNPEKRIGSIPGVDLGHQFFSRAEMVVIGFHSHWLNGIDYIGKTKKLQNSRYEFPLAIAIVLSGQYEDDLDNSDDVVYTGQGGNDLLGNKQQIADQQMIRGNLGLKNCIAAGTPVRVIRGHQSKSSYAGKVYTYDGLYKVHEYWAEKGLRGFTVYKFRLKRLDGQSMLTTNQVQYTRGRVPNSLSEIRGLVCEDITGGLEDIPIPATNLVDDPPVPPTDYIYRKTMKVAQSVTLPKAATGCGCKGTCTDANKCACARLNGSDFPYVHRDGGRLIEAKAVVFECGPNCGCGPECVNRTSQRGIRFRLEVFRTPKKGWGVRSWDYIPSGAFVCEYIGVLMRTEETEAEHENYYLFDIDCEETMEGLEGRERRFRDVTLPADIQRSNRDSSDSDPEFCVDASATGNITRYINHSCQPNLFVQCVLSSHHDMRLARIVLFAFDNIPPLQELTYDYKYKIDTVFGADGKPKNVPCYCGAVDCRKRML